MKNLFKNNISSTKIIGLTVLIILTIGFSIFFITIQSSEQYLDRRVYLLHQSFLSQLDNSTDKIFIIGSSHVNAIDPNRIQERLFDMNYNFDVYNLSLGGYSLEARSKTIDLIIDAKPKIIIFGIAGDDFADELRKVVIEFEQSERVLPDPQENFSIILTDLFLDKYNFLQSPRYFLMNALYDKLNSFNIGNEAILLKPLNGTKMPFFIPSENNYIVKKNIDIDNEFDRKPNTISNLEKNKKLDIFKNMIKKLKNNDIQIIIFTTPFNETYLNTFSDNHNKTFEEIIYNISNEFDLEIYPLTKKYSKLEIWNDFQHIALGSTSNIYTDDIFKIIINEIEN